MPDWTLGTHVLLLKPKAAYKPPLACAGSCTSHVSSSLGCSAMWVAFLLAATLVVVGLKAWRRHRKQEQRDSSSQQQELPAVDKQESRVQGAEADASADLSDESERENPQVRLAGGLPLHGYCCLRSNSA